jgi:hypothetical protein
MHVSDSEDVQDDGVYAHDILAPVLAEEIPTIRESIAQDSEKSRIITLSYILVSWHYIICLRDYPNSAGLLSVL